MKNSSEIYSLKELTLEELIVKMLSIRGLNKHARIKIFIACMDDYKNKTNTRFNIIDEFGKKFDQYLTTHNKN